MTDKEIENCFERKVRDERRITNEVIELIRLVEERRIYASRGYSHPRAKIQRICDQHAVLKHLFLVQLKAAASDAAADN